MEKKLNLYKPIAVQTDADFSEWVAKSGGSLVISTYQAGMMFTVGWLGNRLSMMLWQKMLVNMWKTY